MSAAVTLSGDLLWKGACGFAALEPTRQADPETVYPLGSITKVFVVTMLMQLVEQGIVALEDPLTKYIPEYQVISPFTGSPFTGRRFRARRPPACASLPRIRLVYRATRRSTFG